MSTEIDDGSPFDRVRAALVAEYCSPAVDKMNRSSALAALAEIERELAEQVQASARLASERACEMVRADKAERECAFQAEELRRISAQRDQCLADAAFAEKECDELRAKLAQIEQHRRTAYELAEKIADAINGRAK